MKGPLEKHIIVWIKQRVFGLVLLILLYRAWSGALLHQLIEPVLIFPHADNTYWLLHIIQVPELLVSNFWVALVFDVLLFALPVMALLQINRRIWPILFSVVFGLYFVTFHTYFGHHGHSLVGVLFATLPFWFVKRRTITYAMRAVRYYVIFIYVSAGLYKVFRGSAFSFEQFSEVLKVQHVDLLWDGPNGIRQELALYLIHNPGWAFALSTTAVLIQLSFAIGFFTRRLDAVLIMLGMLFHIGTWLVMDINFWELWIVYLMMLPGKKLQKWAAAGEKALPEPG